MSKTTAPKILDAAIKHLTARAVTYDKPEGERSMAATTAAFYVLTGKHLTEEQGWLFMALLKMVRAQSGNFKLDSYEDGAAYFALAGEAAAEDRGVTDTARDDAVDAGKYHIQRGDYLAIADIDAEDYEDAHITMFRAADKDDSELQGRFGWKYMGLNDEGVLWHWDATTAYGPNATERTVAYILGATPKEEI